MSAHLWPSAAKSSAGDATPLNAHHGPTALRPDIHRLRAEVAVLQHLQRVRVEHEFRRALPATLLDVLSRLTPADLTLTSVDQSGRRLTLGGDGTSEQAVLEFLERLQHDSVLLHDLQLLELRSRRRVHPVMGHGDQRESLTSEEPKREKRAERAVEFRVTASIRPSTGSADDRVGGEP
jgi:Tfp pilus assembly protein PilN